MIYYQWGVSLEKRLGLETHSNINPLSTNFTKWSNTLKQFVGNLPTNCLSMFGHFVGLPLKGLSMCMLGMRQEVGCQRVEFLLL